MTVHINVIWCVCIPFACELCMKNHSNEFEFKNNELNLDGVHS